MQLITVTTTDGKKVELPESARLIADQLEHGPVRLSVEVDAKKLTKDKETLGQVWPGKGRVTVTAGAKPEDGKKGGAEEPRTEEPGAGALFEGTVTGIGYDEKKFGIVALSEGGDGDDDGHGEPGGDCETPEPGDDGEQDDEDQEPTPTPTPTPTPAPGDDGEAPETEPGPDGQQR